MCQIWNSRSVIIIIIIITISWCSSQGVRPLMDTFWPQLSIYSLKIVLGFLILVVGNFWYFWNLSLCILPVCSIQSVLYFKMLSSLSFLYNSINMSSFLWYFIQVYLLPVNVVSATLVLFSVLCLHWPLFTPV